ncbi:MAG: hypothetical protein BGO37_02680 [Cellulomonas sp. 73-92]|nr:MAG: hypothetical protein BGO37_02680 [Cellulomonas sp. 73-92]
MPPLAGRQAGAFTRRQALDAGMTKSEVAWRVHSGVWVPVAGVALRHCARVPDEVMEAHAALLTWPDAVMVLGSAARLHRIPVRSDGRIHVVVAPGRRPRGPLVPHRFPLEDSDTTHVLGIPVTTARRTALDLLGRLPETARLELLAWVSSRRILTAGDLTSWVHEHRRRWGNRARVAAAERLGSGAVNPAEERLHAILRRGGVVGWLGGASLLEHLGIPAQADVYFPSTRLVIEVDGRAAHGPDRFQADLARQNMLVATGCTVLRYTWLDLVARPEDVLAEIRRTLAALQARLR